MRFLSHVPALLHLIAHGLLLAHALGGGPCLVGYLLLVAADLLSATSRRR